MVYVPKDGKDLIIAAKSYKVIPDLAVAISDDFGLNRHGRRSPLPPLDKVE